MQNLVAGQIDIMFDAPAITLPQVRVGTINAYAVMAKARLAVAPDIPTIDEAGLPGLYALNWSALWAPKDTPRNVVAKLNGAIVEPLAHPAVRQRFTDLGFDVAEREQQMPDALAAFQKAVISSRARVSVRAIARSCLSKSLQLTAERRAHGQQRSCNDLQAWMSGNKLPDTRTPPGSSCRP